MSKSDRGAAAVEFALVVPLLILLLAGITEFGRAYYFQTTLSGSAREAVRVMALDKNAPAARTTARTAASPLTLTDSQIAVSPPSSCPTGQNATVTITYTRPYMSGVFGASLTLRGKAVMRCGG